MTGNIERDQFERTYAEGKSVASLTYIFDRWSNGDYAHKIVEQCWRLWLRRAALSQPADGGDDLMAFGRYLVDEGVWRPEMADTVDTYIRMFRVTHKPAAGGAVGEARGTPALDVFTLRLFLKAADERCAVISKLAEAQNSPHARSHIANYQERLRVANGQYEAARGEMLALIDRTSLRAVAAPDESRELAQSAQDVLEERRQQVSREGWTAHNDDKKHPNGQMAQAAACYALHAAGRDAWSPESYQAADPEFGADGDTLWPWGFDWWKPKDPRRDLVRAGALILAEIERIDRATFNESHKR